MPFYGPKQTIKGAFGCDHNSAKAKAHKIKKIANNTYRHTLPSGAIAYRLHSTDILTVCRLNGETTAILNSGGYQTNTTRDRLNTYLQAEQLPYRIYRVQGIWYVLHILDKISVPFKDAMEINKEFQTVKLDTTKADTNKQQHHKDMTRKRAELRKLAKTVTQTSNQINDTIFENAMAFCGVPAGERRTRSFWMKSQFAERRVVKYLYAQHGLAR